MVSVQIVLDNAPAAGALDEIVEFRLAETAVEITSNLVPLVLSAQTAVAVPESVALELIVLSKLSNFVARSAVNLFKNKLTEL